MDRQVCKWKGSKTINQHQSTSLQIEHNFEIHLFLIRYSKICSMRFTKLIPNVFYDDIKDGLNLFVDCLEFTVGYSDFNSKDPCCVVNKDSLAVFLFQNKEYAAKDRPEIRLHTDNIEDAFNKISKTHPQFLHPNLKSITLRPWGAKEFALRDKTDICIIIQQWS